MLSKIKDRITKLFAEQKPTKLSEALFRSIASYIAENYVDENDRKACLEEERQEVVACECIEAPQEIPTIEAASKQILCAPMAAPSAMSLEEMLRQADAGFTETLLKLIDRSGKKDSEIYKKANISKQHFSKIRNNPDYKPTKPTALALAIALELSLEETKDLIGRAGYALTNSSKFDLIIRFFIEQGNYSVVEINIALYEFDQMLLGN